MAADPFDALRQPLAPLQPEPAFATELRRRLERELGINPRGGTMTTTEITTDDASGTTTRPSNITPYLSVKGAAQAIDFYREAFGAVETFRMTGDDGRIGHAEVSIGGIAVMLADEHPEIGFLSPATLGGAGMTLRLPVDDVDATYDRAVAAGAAGVRPPDDQFYGERTATLLDPFGHRWTITHHLADVSIDQIAERAPTYTISRSERPAGELGYFTLVTPDVDRAAAFYGALFGWRTEEAKPSSGGGGHLYRHVENTSVPFGFHDDPGDRHPHLYYRVEHLQAMVARVRELGGEVLEVNEHPSGGTARCRDDQGTEFDLWQPAPGY